MAGGVRVDVPQVHRGQAGLQLRLRLPVPVHLAALLHSARPQLCSARSPEKRSSMPGAVQPHSLQPPAWMRQRVEAPLVQAQVLAPGFVDSIALNIYHDGSEGIQVQLAEGPGFVECEWAEMLARCARVGQLRQMSLLHM